MNNHLFYEGVTHRFRVGTPDLMSSNVPGNFIFSYGI